MKPGWKPNAAANHVYSKCFYDAKRRNKFWGLTKDEFFHLVRLPCHYCGARPGTTMRKGSGNFRHHGLDRKDNRRGYEVWNVVPCCPRCNSIKGQHLSYEEMRVAMRAIVKNCKKL